MKKSVSLFFVLSFPAVFSAVAAQPSQSHPNQYQRQQQELNQQQLEREQQQQQEHTQQERAQQRELQQQNQQSHQNPQQQQNPLNPDSQQDAEQQAQQQYVPAPQMVPDNAPANPSTAGGVPFDGNSLDNAQRALPAPEQSPPTPQQQITPQTSQQKSAASQQSQEQTPAAAKAKPVREREVVTQLQIFLDQQNFGPGIIDGRWGEFTGKALAHYCRAHNLKLTPNIYNELPLDSVYPIYTDYTITEQDAKTVGPVPSQPSEQAKQKRMPYSSLLEFLEERYHAAPDFLKKLNKGKNLDALKAGDTVRVPNVAPFKIEEVKEVAQIPEKPEFAGRTIYINTKDKMLDLYDENKALVAAFPITPGSKSLPAPQGVWTIVGIATMPWFRWDEAMLMHGERSSNFFNIPSGPNNPVGVLWVGLNKRGIGIHGTNTPETIGRAGSHGCIRLANWDAIRFSAMITKGMTVTIE